MPGTITMKEHQDEAFRVLHLLEWLSSRKQGTKKSSDFSDELTQMARMILKNKNHDYYRSIYYD